MYMRILYDGRILYDDCSMQGKIRSKYSSINYLSVKNNSYT